MPVATVNAVLNAATPVTALVANRISPVVATQGVVLPYVTVAVLNATPLNSLSGYSNLDDCRVLVTAWALTYAQALSVAKACRTALEAAGHLCESRDADEATQDPDPGLYAVEHQFVIWK